MGIGDYVTGVRGKVNAGGRWAGNKVYDGLGDKLSEDISLRSAGLACAVGGLAFSVSGCAEAILAERIYNHGKNVGRQEAARQNVEQKELFVFHWRDFNNNGQPEEDSEFLGNVEGPIDLKKYGLVGGLRTGDNSLVNYFILDSNGKRVASGSGSRATELGFMTTPGIYSGDWLDDFNGAVKDSPGEYTFYAHQDGETFKKSIVTITGDVSSNK